MLFKIKPFLFSCQILQVEKFKGADFIQWFFEILVQKYPNKAFFVPTLGIFVSSQSFAVRHI